MENLQNLLKLKEEEIEKLNAILSELKRKIVESNDKISLKDMKISNLSQEIEDLKEKLNNIPQNSSKKTESGVSPSLTEKSSPDLENFKKLFMEKFDQLEATIQKNFNDISQKFTEFEEKILQSPKKHVSETASRPILTPTPRSPSRLPSSPSTQARKPSQVAKMQEMTPAKPSEISNKRMVPPVVNVAKVNQKINEKPSIEPEIIKPTSSTNSSIPVIETPDIPDEYTDTETLSSHKSVSPSITKNQSSIGSNISPASHSNLTMGQYGVPTIPYPADGLIKCPKCGGNKIQEMENKKKIVMFNPRKYGKKYYCKECRAEWDYEY